MRISIRSVVAVSAIAVSAPALSRAQPAPARTLDDFSTVAGWTAHPSDGTVLTIASDSGVRGEAMRLDFDFRGSGGYVIARRELPIAFPANYEIRFRIRGRAPTNNLEIKFVDRSGDNVWWVNKRDFAFPSGWTEVVLKKRHISFAWGPSGGGDMKEAAAIEFAITAGGGGKGSVWIDQLELVPLEPVREYTATPRISASSAIGGNGAAAVLDGRRATSWRSRPNAGPIRPGLQMSTLAFDFVQIREIGGLTIVWGPEDYATGYVLETSADGLTWTPVHEIRDGNGGFDYIPMPETETRRLRLRLNRSSRGRGYEIAEVEVQPLAWSESPNAFFASIAKDAPRGTYPKYHSGIQSYWTLIGVSGDPREAMINEEGMIETGKGQFSIEPFLYTNGGLVTWADARPTQSLERGDLPIPSVRWATQPIDLTITGFATGARGASVLHARYRLENRTSARQQTTLFLAIRPFQVNPSWQFLNTTGGVASITALRYDSGRVVVNRERVIHPITAPSAFGATSFDRGSIVESLRRGTLPTASAVGGPLDPNVRRPTDSYSSGALAYRLDIAPGETKEIFVAVPLNETPSADGFRVSLDSVDAQGRLVDRIERLSRILADTARPEFARTQPPPSAAPADPSVLSPPGLPLALPEAEARAYGQQQFAVAVREWSAQLDAVGIHLPASAERVARIIRSNLAYILINRDGPAIQPGSRSYERSWIRDGALTSAALLRLGHHREVREFIEWYAPYQFRNGKVPCCVDDHGAGPVPEHDSHGQLIYLIAEYHRFTRDTALLARMWPHVVGAVRYIDTLRAERMTPEYRTGDKRAYYGLVPQSISHEGYSAKPMHSYWDDAFVLRGLKDATAIAEILGKRDTSAVFAAKRDEFRRNLMDSYRFAMQMHGIDYLPGSVELGDFDATSTTVAIAPGGEIRTLPQPALNRTFQKYLENFRGRRDGTVAWENYTPYELRTVGTLVRLGQKAVAHELLDFFFRDVRPTAWNHWAEVVWRDPATPKFIGDMPHTWVGSDYIRSVTDMFAYEREDDDALVVGAGIAEDWVTTAPGVSIRALATHYGPLTYTMSGTASEVRVRIETGVRVPAGGIALQSPFARPIVSATVNGQAVVTTGRELVVRSVPAEVVIRY